MNNSTWFDDLPVIASLPPHRAASILRDVGETDLALALGQQGKERGQQPATFSDGIFGFLSKPKPPWMHAAHTFGFLPRKPDAGKERHIQPAGEINADESLRNARIKISLNRLRVAAYPGGGTHNILFDFYANNQVVGGSEDVHFNRTWRVEDGSEAGVVGLPIFVGLGVSSEGVSFRCYTVNVKNNEDEAFLSVLDSNVFKKGLQLATVAQPALGPLSELAVGLTRAFASRHRNVPVQNFEMGLDFDGPRMGARIAQGDYIAVQIPMELRRVWKWSEWEYDSESGQVINADDGSLIPFNYVVFGVTKYSGI
jgi:hypothetical protein